MLNIELFRNHPKIIIELVRKSKSKSRFCFVGGPGPGGPLRGSGGAAASRWELFRYNSLWDVASFSAHALELTRTAEPGEEAERQAKAIKS